jgi:hypothetical protein
MSTMMFAMPGRGGMFLVLWVFLVLWRRNMLRPVLLLCGLVLRRRAVLCSRALRLARV